jgi:hypothetical protein
MNRMECLKERQWPFLLSSDEGGKRFFQSLDKSVSGYVWVYGDQYELDCLRDAPDGPFLFKTPCHAAFFACMKDKEYFAEVTVLDERIEIRISPNFGAWYGSGCKPGLWAATLYNAQSRLVDLACAPTDTEAKTVGVQRAFFRDNLTREHARMFSERLSWGERQSKPNAS